MLLRFTVDNFLSFHDEASISLIATSDRSHPDHVSASREGRRPAALRLAAVYGANGHGKSKLVESIIALQRHVRGRPWRPAPFKLDPKAADAPTRMIAEFRFQGNDFEYGTVLSKDHVAEEWLFVTGSDDREEKLFERITQRTNDGKFKTVVQPGKLLSNLPSPTEEIKMATFIKVLGSGVKANCSFIAEAEERDLGLVTEAFNWFDDVLTTVSATSSYSPLFERLTEEESFRDFISQYMKRCDVGIEKIESNRAKLEAASLEEFPENFRNRLEQLENESAVEFGAGDGTSMQFERDETGELFVRDLTSYRKDITGELVKFNLEEESSGTRRLFDLLPMIAEGSDERVFVVDELDRKLHPLLAYEFIQSFANSRGQQLLFTTHNTHLMSLELLRRDEIWFVQKKSDGSSDLYGLSEMKVRNDLNIRKGYIAGRFGAIPFIGNPAELGLGNAEVTEHGAH